MHRSSCSLRNVIDRAARQTSDQRCRRSTLCSTQQPLQSAASQRLHPGRPYLRCQTAAPQARHGGRPPLRCQAAAAQHDAEEGAAAEDFDGDVCLPPDISVDNDSHKEYSIVTIEVSTALRCHSFRSGMQLTQRVSVTWRVCEQEAGP